MDSITENALFCDYYAQWVQVYKEGAIRDVTMGKYRLTLSWLKRLIPSLRIKDLDRTSYQQLINDYAKGHERQTTMDFHHQLKGAILDAVDEGLIQRDPTRKAIIKGKQPRQKKVKYLNQFELCPSIRHGITRMEVALFQQRMLLRYVKYNLTGNSSCSCLFC